LHVALEAPIGQDASMPALWITLTVSLVVSILVTILYSRRSSRVTDLGVISDRWIAQHRAGSRDSAS
jgi:hypothetical protein